MTTKPTNPLSATMTQAQFEAVIRELQEIQKRVPWNDPRKRVAHDRIRALVLEFKGVDIGEME